jgi:hypothetical protein
MVALEAPSGIAASVPKQDAAGSDALLGFVQRRLLPSLVQVRLVK